jgi:putative nucleotidyltransferase with HDIG domain
MRLKDGSLRWHKWIDTALFDEQGNVLEYQSIGVDITEEVIARQNLAKALEKLHRTYERTIEAMGKILEIKDPYTASHQKKVALISESIAKEMGLGKEETEQIYLGALVHDIGKIYIPSELLSKPGKLSELEFQLIKDHTTKGEEILRPISEDLPIWEVALYHHERMNGSGYPHGLKGKDIPLSARIVAVADVVDAMSSHRHTVQPSLLSTQLKSSSKMQVPNTIQK